VSLKNTNICLGGLKLISKIECGIVCTAVIVAQNRSCWWVLGNKKIKDMEILD